MKTQIEEGKRVYYLNINQKFAHIYETYDKSMYRAIESIIGSDGIWLAVPLAEALTIIISIIYIVKLKSHYKYL